MAGRSASSTITRYAGIQVQTSALGLNVPVGWGTFRCKCNLVDYLDFKSKSQTAAASKGGTTTGYSYSATVILALCEGPIDSVSTIYVDGKVYTNAAKTALAQANLNLNTGAIGQPVWSYLTSNHAAHAIGYSGLTIAYQSNYALDSGAQTPNHSFEVVRTASFGVAGTPDADPSLVVTDFFTNVRYGVPSWASGLLGDLTQYQDYCLAAGLLVSPVIDSQRSASDFLTELLKATNSTCVWSEGLLKFLPYGDTALTGNGRTYAPNNTPVYSLNDDDYIPQAAGDDPLTIDIEDQSDAYNVVQLEYLDRTNEYNMAIALASDAANVAQYGMRRKDPDTVHCIATPTVAALSAQLFLQRTLYIRSQFKFTLGWQFALLEPGDILELTDTALGLNACPVRIVQIDDDEDACRAIIAEDFPVGVSHAPLYTMQTGAAVSRDTNIDPGGVEANLLLWSGDISQSSAWGLSDATISSGTQSDQYGFSTAHAIIPTSGLNGAHQVIQAVSSSYLFAGVSYTFGACLQAGAHHIAELRCGDGDGDGWNVVFDLSAGVVLNVYETSGTYPGNVTLIGYGVEPTLVSGIWQCFITVQATALPAGLLNWFVYADDDSADNTWTGDGSNAIWVSQAQLRQGVALGVYAATTTTPAAPIVFNPPAALNDGGSTMFAAVAGGPNWGGCNVWISIDGTDFNEIGTITSPARYGLLTASFPPHADPDTADTLSVDLGWSGGALAGASQASVDNGATTSWIGGELVGYETATLTNPSRYNLGTYIRRGFQNTPISTHNVGDAFVRLDDAIFDFPYLDINSGETVYLKFQSFNLYGQALQSLADCITYSAVPNPVAANAPNPASWTAAGATLSSGGVVVPVLEITAVSPSGAVADNPSATAIQTFTRVHGATPWVSGGAFADSSTTMYLPAIVSGQSYDVGIAYIVGGVQTGITQIGTDILIAAAVAPSVVNQGALATSSLSPSEVANANVPAVGVNRVPLSLFELGASVDWAAGATGMTGFAEQVVQVSGYSTFEATATATASGQYLYINSSFFPVTGGEQLAIKGLIGTTNGVGVALVIYWYDGTGAQILGVGVASTTLGFAQLVQGMETAPSNARTALLQCAVASTGAGSYGISLAQPFVSGAAPGQTAFPTFTPGPNAQSGATKNVTTYAGTAPSTPAPTNGDIWVDTAVNPNTINLYQSGSWTPVGTYTLNTNQLTDGAGLGLTAQWTNIVGQANAPANNATKNVTTYGASAPSGGSNGDIWVYTGVTPNVTYLNVSGTWEVAANHVTSTSDITDGAGLGNTAIWTSVSSRPVNLAGLTGTEAINNATLQAALTAGSPTVIPTQAGSITSQAAAATDSTIQPGATNNQVFGPTGTNPLSTNPSLGDNAIWINNSLPIPGYADATFILKGGVWQCISGVIPAGVVLCDTAAGGSSPFVLPLNARAEFTITARGGDGGGDTHTDVQGASGGIVVWQGSGTPGSTSITFAAGAAGSSINIGGGSESNGTQTTASCSSPSFSLNAGGGEAANAGNVGGAASGGNVSNTAGSSSAAGDPARAGQVQIVSN